MLPTSFEHRHPSRREPVFGDAVVATSQPLAAQAGLEMLAEGGTSVDAAIATAAALTVTEPTSNGLGSDAFCLHWDAHRLHGFNGSGRSPAAFDSEGILARGQIQTVGWEPVTIPGAIDAWFTLHERFGKLPMARLLEPAIRMAQHGFRVAPQTAYYWSKSATKFGHLSGWTSTFTRDGRTPRPGERIQLPEHALTLKTLARDGRDAFYGGELAECLHEHSVREGGALRVEDLANHSGMWVDPISMTCGDVTFHQIPPNGQGIAMLFALGILRELDALALDPDGVEGAHLAIEAMKLGFREAHRMVADPEHVPEAPEEALQDERIHAIAMEVDPKRAQDFDHGVPKPGGTVLMCAADARGRATSFIQSNYMGFGSGIVVPGTGIALQNRGCGFVCVPDHPNVAAPSKRPYHTIIPGFVTRAGVSGPEPVMAFGVMGGMMQPQGQLQVGLRVMQGASPQAALDAPRWRVEEGLLIAVEPQCDAAWVAGLEALGHRIARADKSTVSFGGGQAILRHEGGWCGGSDPRRDGQAVAR